MGNIRQATTFLLGAALLLFGQFSARGLTDEEAKRAFLRSRGKPPSAEPASTPLRETARPRPKPQPARKKSQPPPPQKAERVRRATPRPTPEPTPPPERNVSSAPPKPTPTPAPTRASKRKPDRRKGTILIEKSSGDEENSYLPPPSPERRGFLFFRSKAKYKYLTPAVRKAIDQARVRRHRWRYIVVHNSGTRQGNAKAFEYYHRKVRKMPNGMAYHFVIGNGSSTGNGEIEIGERWRKQINGGHVHSDFLNNIALGICFVGDYNKDRPTRQQLEALDELIRYLRRRVGKTEGKEAIIKAHKDINPRPTDCPGNKFPYTWLYTRFD